MTGGEQRNLREYLAIQIGRIRVHQESEILELNMDLKDYNQFVGTKSVIAELKPSGLVQAWNTGGEVSIYSPVQAIFDLADSKHAFTALIFAWLHDALLDDDTDVYELYLGAIERGADAPECVEWDITDDAFAKLLTGHLLLPPKFPTQFESQEIFDHFLSWHSRITAKLVEIYVSGQVPRVP